MNSDPSPASSAAGSSPSAANRSSNLKSRWKRAPGPGVPAPRPATLSPANFGEVKDITAARETLSGQHAKGYAPGEAAPPPPARPAPAPVAAPKPPEPVTRPTPAPERPREFSPPPPRREAPPPKPASANRDGSRETYVALKPDPANDPAPRRLRTENSKPVPVEEYAPSAFARVPDKSIPARANRDAEKREDHRRDGDRRESRRDSRESTSPRPHSSIPANPPRSKELDKPKTTKAKSRGGIVGFIKRIFGGGETAVEEPARERRESSGNDDRRSSRERDGDDRRDSRHHRHRRNDNRQRHARDDRSRDSDRR